MVLGAIVGSNAMTAGLWATRPKSLTVGGLDMILKPGVAVGNLYGVPIESIQVKECGPNGVSDMSFVINDPLGEVDIREGMAVVFWDCTRDAPIFNGLLQAWTYTPTPGPGRDIAVGAIGLDAVLDWMKIASLTIPQGTRVEYAIQSAYANAIGVGVSLNLAINVGSAVGRIPFPMADQWDNMGYDVVLANVTLREALHRICDAAVGAYRITFWVDAYGGLRTVYEPPPPASPQVPFDYVDITVDDSAGPNYGAGLRFGIDATGVPHQVYVVGGTPAGSALVSDGTGLPGPVAQLNDPASTTAAMAQAIGTGYLADLRSQVRGQVGLSAYSPLLSNGAVDRTNQRAGTTITLTDPNIGVVHGVYRVVSISKTFNDSGTEEWSIAFGGQAPSAVRLMRKLTRDELS